MFSGDDPRKFNFNQFVGLGWQQLLIDFGDVKSLLKKHYGDFDDLTWGFSEEEINRVKEALRKRARTHAL